MILHTSSFRAALAGKIARAANSGADAIADARLNRPEDQSSCDVNGNPFSHDTLRLHYDFLAGAIEAGSPASFTQYTQWAARMLVARGSPGSALHESFHEIGLQLRGQLTAEEYAQVLSFLQNAPSDHPAATPANSTEDAHGPLKLVRDVFRSAILHGKRQAALAVVQKALQSGCSLPDVYVEVFDGALREIGKCWESNRITVAQEHMATAITQYVIASIYPSIEPRNPMRGAMVVTGVSGELHQIGANLVADAMEAEGWNVHFLGSNLPGRGIVDAVEENAADVLCISTTLVANLPAAANLIRAVRARLDGRAPRIVVGGSAYTFAAEFANELGVTNLTTNLRAALHLLCA